MTPQTKPTARETTPPGFEHVVKALKEQPNIENPWAVAWAMHNQGIAPQSESGRPYELAALLRRLQFAQAPRPAMGEALSPTTQGALLRKGVYREAHRDLEPVCFRERAPLRIRERDLTPSAGMSPTARVVLITEGPGNLRDRNFYPAEALERSVRAFEGARCFINHPTATEEDDRPERNAKELAGWWSQCRVEDVDGRQGITATLNFSSNGDGQEAVRLTESELRYQEQFPGTDQQFCGFSVNASGASHMEVLDETGEPWRVADSMDRVASVDLVTYPARGGRVVSLMREGERERSIASWQFRRRLAAATRSAAFRATLAATERSLSA